MDRDGNHGDDMGGNLLIFMGKNDEISLLLVLIDIFSPTEEVTVGIRPQAYRAPISQLMEVIIVKQFSSVSMKQWYNTTRFLDIVFPIAVNRELWFRLTPK